MQDGILHTRHYIEMHGQQNIKRAKCICDGMFILYSVRWTFYLSTKLHDITS